MIEYADIVVGLSFGDEGKGAVVYNLCKSKYTETDYSHVLRTGGGSNAGHTIYHNGKKFVTHQIPTGIFFGKKCIIGSGCVVNPQKLFEEMIALEGIGVNTYKKVFIAKNAHVVTDEHLLEEEKESKIGTTKQGIGPAYRDKYNRTGIQAKDVESLKPYLIDLYDEFYNENKDVRVLCEGAQGFGLDIDWGDYPFVTSSHCTTAGALLCGIPFTKIRKIFGCTKAYDTYVGSKQFEPPNDKILARLRELGNEYGATTGRPRQCNYLDLDLLKKAVNVNSVTDLIVSKVDILQDLNSETDDNNWKFLCASRFAGDTVWLQSKKLWIQYLEDELMDDCESIKRFHYRYGPED